MIKINVITNNNSWFNYLKKPNYYLDKKISRLNSKEKEFRNIINESIYEKFLFSGTDVENKINIIFYKI